MEISDPRFNARIKRCAEKRMAIVDAWPREMRELVHEIGFPIVHQFWMAGVRDPRTIRHLVSFVRGEYGDGRTAWVGNHRLKT